MKDKKLTIQINKPASEVFAFTTDPKNTSAWVGSIVAEQTNEWPARLGTAYKNQNRKGQWSTYTMTDFKENETFTMTAEDKNYHVRYTFRPISEDSVELEYYEWVDNGEIEDPFTQGILEKLKTVLENKQRLVL